MPDDLDKRLKDMAKKMGFRSGPVDLLSPPATAGPKPTDILKDVINPQLRNPILEESSRLDAERSTEMAIARQDISPSRALAGIEASPQRFREAVPSLAAILGGALTGGSVPMVKAVGGALLGGAAGEAGAQLFGRAAGLNEPSTSGESAKDIINEGAINAAIEGAFRGGGRVVKFAAEKFGKSIPIRGSAKSPGALEYISPELGGAPKSPAEFGAFVRQETSTAQKTAGDAIDAVVAQFPDIRPTPRNSLAILSEEIEALERTPDARKEGTRLNRLLGVLKEQESLLASPATEATGAVTGFTRTGNPIREAVDTGRPVIDDLLKERSRFSQAAREYDPTEATRISKRLAQAAHADIVASLEAGGRADLVPAFEAASGRFRQVKTAQRAIDELKNVFNPAVKKVPPAKVVEALNVDPQTAVKAIEVISQDNPATLSTVRRALFEDMATRGTLPEVREDVLKAVFQSDYAKVSEFSRAIREAGPKNHLLSWFSTGKFGLRMPSGPTTYISARDFAKVLDNPIGLESALNLVKARIGSQEAAQYSRLLIGIHRATKSEDDGNSSAAR